MGIETTVSISSYKIYCYVGGYPSTHHDFVRYLMVRGCRVTGPGGRMLVGGNADRGTRGRDSSLRATQDGCRSHHTG